MPSEQQLGNIAAPVVSVIVTNHNYAEFLEACLYSVLGQSYSNIECIVIDNASTDGSHAILDAFMSRGDFNRPGRSLKLVKFDVNLHQMRANVDAFKEASGSFIIFFDADDCMLPTCVEAHIRAMLYLRVPVGATSVDMFQSRGDELVVSTSCTQFAEYILSNKGRKSEFCRVTDTKLSLSGDELRLSPSELHFVDRKAKGWHWSSTSALCFRREMVELMFTRAPPLQANLDSYLIKGINALTGSVLIDRPLVIYRLHASNIFAKMPALTNFLSYDPTQPAGDLRIPAEEAIETLLSLADILAKRLVRPAIFIEAIHALAATWPGIKPHLPVGSYTFDFLIRNEQKLKESFGEKVYAVWVWRYRRSWRDFLFFARKSIPSHRHQPAPPAFNRREAVERSEFRAKGRDLDQPETVE